MRRLLAIETSSERCSVALALDGEARLVEHHEPLRHAELVLPAVRSLLDEAGIRLGTLDGIVFGRGPGGFTSLRIGIGVVQGLAFGAGLPVIPVSSLACVAQQLNGSGGEEVLVALDARMEEVFHCRFGFNAARIVRPLTEEMVGDPACLGVPEPAITVAAGNGFARYAALTRLGASMRALRADLLPSALALLPLAQDWLGYNEPLPAEQAQPKYVRNRVAEKPAAGRDRGPE